MGQNPQTMPDEHPKIIKNLKDFTPGFGCRGEGSRAMLPALVLQPWLAAVGGRQMYIENILKSTQRNADTKKIDISLCSGNCWTGFQEFGPAH